MNLIAHLRDLAREGSSARVSSDTLTKAANALEATEANLAEWKAPVERLEGSFPVVLYFGTDAERADFIAMVRSVHPEFTAKPL